MRLVLVGTREKTERGEQRKTEQEKERVSKFSICVGKAAVGFGD